MLKKLKNKSEGFTIIEVMIVLAIAGLIILIVLLAVPALQRNGRNTAIKNDASALAAGIAEFGSNNDGRIPTAAASTFVDGIATFSRAGTGISPAEAKYQASTTVNAGATDPTEAGVIRVQFGVKCTGPNAFATTNNTRGTAIKYLNEQSGGGTSPRCIDA
jgi:prepilin-type N-terminal cleavage/methylation domain-containing protein